MTKLQIVQLEGTNSSSNVPQNGVVIQIVSDYDNSNDGEIMVPGKQINSSLFVEEDGALAAIIDSQFKSEGAESLCVEEVTVMDADMEPISLTFINKKVPNSVKILELVEDLAALSDDSEPVIIEANSGEMKIEKRSFTWNFPSLWGVRSICGRRSEMEDYVVAMPRFLNIPSQMLSDSQAFSSISRDFDGHVFGVYDGHGGSQVAKYCEENLHLVLADEIEIAKESLLTIETGENNWKQRWVKIFMDCFHRIDDEVGGLPRTNGDTPSDPPVAHGSVGSTAVVAVVCANHIIVANCGDSRAVLCRGKLPMPLSFDHKPNREDECARIEAAGGRVINWDGYRVSGFLAVSRSIGDGYFRPYVIPDPEVMFISRAKEDECIILASDGLWDVMTNEDACNFARRRILLWHKKNGTPKERGYDIDPAAQDAANYLSQLAFKRGSRDNISVIVVDLKAQRKFKSKS